MAQAVDYRISSRLFVAALILLGAVSTPTFFLAQVSGAVTGKVTAENGLALSGANVEVQGTKLRATTDDQGRFRLNEVPAGQANIEVRRLGFHPDLARVQVPPSGTAEVSVALPILAENLVPVTVRARKLQYSGRLAGYYARLEHRNGGVFVTREEIDRDRPRALSQLLQRVPGVTIVRLRAGSTGLRLRDRTCAPLMWLDGNALPAGEVDLDSFQPTSLQGIELYLGATTAPSRYVMSRDMSNCGTILLWSRGGDTDFPQEMPSTAAQLEDLVASHAIFTSDQVDEPARPDSTLALETVYPSALNAAHVDGLVIAEFVVGSSGRVEDETFGVVSSTHPLFTEAVRNAVRKATFRPALVKGTPVRQLVHQPFEFTGEK
jgi:TonB family protein